MDLDAQAPLCFMAKFRDWPIQQNIDLYPSAVVPDLEETAARVHFDNWERLL
jgi:hypothetical protein